MGLSPGVTAVLAGGFLSGGLFLFLYRKKSTSTHKPDKAGHIIEELLPVERGKNVLGLGGISTATFFQGDFEAAGNALQDRVNAIAEMNPWLDGRLVFIDGCRPGLMYPLKPKLSIKVYSPEEVQLTRKMSYEQVISIVYKNSLNVVKGTELLVTDEPVLKISLIPDYQDRQRFALVVSLSHVLADGHTFYRVHNMLSKDEPVVRLNPKRKLDVQARILEAVGPEQANFLTNFPFGFGLGVMLGALRAKILGPSNVMSLHILDQSAIASRKSTQPPRISTNDIVTSSFLTSARANLGFMAINFRNKISGCEETDAGNYEGLLIYRPPDTTTPGLIRGSIQSLQRASTPPTDLHIPLWQHLTSNYALVSNWAGFTKTVSLHGATQDLHIPLFRTSNPFKLSARVATCVLFRPNATDIAVILIGTPATVARFCAEDLVGRPLF